MYLKITQYCNMSCKHCCMNSGTYGKHMPLSMAQEAILFASEYTDRITIGGGEPTTHPNFFEILKYALEYFDGILIVTNGSDRNAMFKLHNIIQGTYDNFEWGEHFEDCPVNSCECVDGDDYYSEEETCPCWGMCECDIRTSHEEHLAVALSQDIWHDPIDPRVVQLWKDNKYEIRNVGGNEVRTGRAKLTGNWSTEDHCVCDTPIIMHTGKIRQCGCDNAPFIGDIRLGFKEGYEYEEWFCTNRGKD